jgi:hypothetical protein
MKLFRTLTLSVCFAAALSGHASEVRADGPKPISEQAPAKPTPTPPAEATRPAARRDTLFDPKGFGPVDPTTAKIVRNVEETCHESPFSRDGMSPAEEAKCNVQVARLIGRGALAVPAILARLNDRDGLESYYARTRLYHVLGRQHDQRVRVALVDALVWIGDTETEHHGIDGPMIEESLTQAFGSAPPPTPPWVDEPVVEAWAEARRDAARWSEFAKSQTGKSRGHIVAESMARARKELASADAAVAFRAISSLMLHAPREAGRAAEAYASREGLEGEQQSAFENLASEAEWKSSPDHVRGAML